MRRRIGIIGTGWVGASVAISVLHAGLCDELLLHDARGDVAEGEAMDLSHGAAFYPSASVQTAAIEEMADTDAVVITAGRGGKAGESRCRERAAPTSARLRKTYPLRPSTPRRDPLAPETAGR